MKTEINHIVQQLFRCDSLEELSEKDLQQFVEEFPYVTAGHLLLAKKQNDSGASTPQVLNKASLYVNHPLWMQWLLDSSKFTNQKELVLEPFHIHSGEEGEIEKAEKEQTERENAMPQTTSFQQTSWNQPTQKQAEIHDGEIAREDADNTDAVPAPSTSIDPPIFQSYHTVDYFASLGIKLQQADFGKDKLGQQLRSFTDWLRSMKRLPQADPSDTEDPAEQTVRIIAESSIEEREVLTEAMAEVWAKQGNRQKASDIYRKLSLLNPAKSAHFAAKIDQL